MGIDPPDLDQRLRDRVQYRAAMAMSDTKQATRNAFQVDQVIGRQDVIMRQLGYSAAERLEMWEALAHRCLALVAEARKEKEAER
jgi:hypothetical protein